MNLLKTKTPPFIDDCYFLRDHRVNYHDNLTHLMKKRLDPPLTEGCMYCRAFEKEISECYENCVKFESKDVIDRVALKFVEEKENAKIKIPDKEIVPDEVVKYNFDEQPEEYKQAVREANERIRKDQLKSAQDIAENAHKYIAL